MSSRCCRQRSCCCNRNYGCCNNNYGCGGGYPGGFGCGCGGGGFWLIWILLLCGGCW